MVSGGGTTSAPYPSGPTVTTPAWLCLQLEMGILDQPDDVPERIGHGRDLDLLPDVVCRRHDRCTGRHEMTDGLVQLLHAPIRHRATRTGRRARRIWVEPELVAADVEAHIERLVEVGGLAKRRGVPGL